MSSSPISPIVPGSSPLTSSLILDVQAIVKEHTESLPSFDRPDVGCNVLLMPEGTPACIASVGHLSPKAAVHWASVTKQFTAAAIAKLVGSHRISYDTDIRTILVDLPPFTLDGVEKTITINDLLYMRSGLSEVVFMAALSGKNADDLTVEDNLDLLKKHPKLLFSPGEQCMYCNTNYFLLAKVVETVAAPKTYPEFLRDEVLPKEMQGRCTTDPACPVSAEGFPQTCKGLNYGPCGLVAPIEDMLFWNASIAKSDCPDLREPPKGAIPQLNEPVYCRGLFITQVDGGMIIQHAGGIEGFRTLYRRYEDTNDPSKSFAFFIVANSEKLDQGGALAKMGDAIFARMGKKPVESIPRAAPEIIKIAATKEEVEGYRGAYHCQALGFTDAIEIIEEDSTWKIIQLPKTDHEATVEELKNEPHFFPVKRNMTGQVTDFTCPEQGAHIRFSPDARSFLLQVDDKLAPLTFDRMYS